MWLCREADIEVTVAKSAPTDREGGGKLHRRLDTKCFLFVLLVRRTSRIHHWSKMEDEGTRKMKEKFGLRRDILKEFLAEFLGIFVLIVSTSLCTCQQLKQQHGDNKVSKWIL